MTERTITFNDEEWQLVPRKPTPGMLAKALACTAAFLNLTGSKATVNFKKMSIRYRAMLAAAHSRECSQDRPTRGSACAAVTTRHRQQPTGI